MVSVGKEFLRSAPWVALFPGLSLAAAVLALNLLGDSLRDALDPRGSRGVASAVPAGQAAGGGTR
jgi:peptide/nickel transport system permease protein